MATTETGRARLIAAVDARRAGIEQYLAEKRPVHGRLTTVGIVSSCVAAALAAGPAVGGEDVARTVQSGLRLDQPQAVWRLLCIAAVIASLTAAIAANLSRSGELSTRIGAAEAAASLLDGLVARLRFSRLPLADGARQYEEIVTRIPWISEADGDAGTSGGRDGATSTRDRQARYLVGATVLAASFGGVAAVGLVAGLVRGDGSADPATGDTVVAVPASPTSSAAAGPVPGDGSVFSGRTGNNIAIAVVIDGSRAAAYLCDGSSVEAWYDGRVADGRLSLSTRSGETLTGDLTGAELTGTADVDGAAVGFRIAAAGGAAGVYEARETIDGAEVRLGWAVLADGSSVGVTNRSGQLDPAPALTFPGATFELGDDIGTAERRSGSDPVVTR